MAIYAPKPRILTPTAGFIKPAKPVLDYTHPINRGIVRYWPLSDNTPAALTTASNILECSTRNQRASSVCKVTASNKPGHHGGTSTEFVNASADGILLAYVDALLGAAPRTVSLWMYPTEIPAGASQRCMFQTGLNAAYRNFTCVHSQSSSGDLAVAFNTTIYRTATGAVAANSWYHIVGTYNGGLLNTTESVGIWKNGIAQSLTLASGTAAAANTGNTAACIGGNAQGGTPQAGFGGYIADVRVWRRVLSAGEIRQLYSQPYIGVTEAGAFNRSGTAPVDIVFYPRPILQAVKRASTY